MVDAINSNSKKEATTAAQRAAGAKLSHWLLTYGGGCTLEDCTPDDLLAYMVAWWLTHHHGRGGVGSLCKPSTVSTQLGLLSG
ncbi:hypothetical protein TSOC_000033 [Tetrabaena socialis]|uniref:Uncharacterized protein n=1 Tax=Tetrabaena socialis TaxID=47790 RepID=A0A2J8AKC9_9CHLO|nr:hypothetical protein TSOC_000033 [Tetrabaena socialis]|eukprot:PNH12972.1 hypothetical protein TSOC_000033 [Tetrabaena socialis]